MSVSTFTVYPYSRGHIHITGKGIDSRPDFQTGFFSDNGDVDIKKSVWAYKKQREILRRLDLYRGEYAACHPPFAAGSEAACEEFAFPLRDIKGLKDAKDIKDIVYTPADDRVLERWIRQHVSTTWLSMGTCRMASPSADGVVDGSLGVYGVENLKVADSSISPQNVAANTANTTFLVGEKAADIFMSSKGGRGKLGTV